LPATPDERLASAQRSREELMRLVEELFRTPAYRPKIGSE
jgi:hypothetical protein